MPRQDPNQKPELEIFIAQYKDKGKETFQVHLSGRGIPPDDGKSLPAKLEVLVPYVKKVEQEYEGRYQVVIYPVIDDGAGFWRQYLPKNEGE